MPLLLGGASAVTGCGAPAAESSDLPAVDEGVTPDIFPDTRASMVEFVPGGELRLVAGQTAALNVRVSPPGQHTVRFALLGDAENAFLSESVVNTAPDGSARTTLTALSAASTFSVRAAAGRVSGTLAVTTLQASLSSLLVTPIYEGDRPVEAWAASVHLGVTCSSLQGVPYPDGQLLATGESSVRVDGIPAETPLAIVVRAGQFAGGCRGLTPLRANSLSSVEVEVMDRPLQTGNLALNVAFGVEPTDAPNPALEQLAFRAAGTLTAGASDDLAALLDAMAAASADAAAFQEARAAQGWRAALVSGLAPELPGNGLRTLVQDWMHGGIELLESPDALRGHLSAPTGEPARLRLESVIGLDPEAAGFELDNAASAVAETDDFLRLGATLEWLPSTFLSAAANLTALERNPDLGSAAEVMAAAFGCEDVASIISNAGAPPGQAFAGCDEACMLELCRSGMGELWARVAGSALPAVPWQVSGASRAQIDDEARPTRVDGNWIGTLTVPDFETTPIQGPFSGEAAGD